jgi:hypothetical protein
MSLIEETTDATLDTNNRLIRAQLRFVANTSTPPPRKTRPHSSVFRGPRKSAQFFRRRRQVSRAATVEG